MVDGCLDIISRRRGEDGAEAIMNGMNHRENKEGYRGQKVKNAMLITFLILSEESSSGSFKAGSRT